MVPEPLIVPVVAGDVGLAITMSEVVEVQLVNDEPIAMMDMDEPAL